MKTEFPNLLHEPIGVTMERGMPSHKVELSEPWKYFFGQLIQALQTNFNAQGYSLPQLTSSEISQLDGQKSNNNILIDSTTNEAKIFLNNTLKTIQTV